MKCVESFFFSFFRISLIPLLSLIWDPHVSGMLKTERDRDKFQDEIRKIALLCYFSSTCGSSHRQLTKKEIFVFPKYASIFYTSTSSSPLWLGRGLGKWQHVECESILRCTNKHYSWLYEIHIKNVAHSHETHVSLLFPPYFSFLFFSFSA